MSAVEQLREPNIQYYGEIDHGVPLELVEVGALFPNFEQIREGFQEDGLAILDANRRRFDAGDYESVPLSIDVLSTARRLRQIKTEFGEHSPQYAEGYHALFCDSSTMLAETLRTNRPDISEKIYQPLDTETGDYTFNGVHINPAVVSGLSPLAVGYEQPIRVIDYVKHQVNRLLGNSLLARKGVSTISVNECPDQAIADFQLDPKASYSNYAPRVQKLVLEESEFDERGRTYQQISLPGLYITHEVVVESLKEAEALDQHQLPGKEDIRSMEFVNQGKPALLRFTALLDKNASIASGLNIFMGEVVAEDHPKNYEDATIEAAIRRQSYAENAMAVTELQIGLEEQETDSRLASIKLGGFVKEMMFDESIKDPTIAIGVFDNATAIGAYKINELLALGMYEEANNLSVKVLANAPEPSSCGAGSCGLEAVSQFSREAIEAKKAGLNTDSLLKDKERSCPDCHYKTVIYDLKSGSKLCINPKCKKTEKKK
jgi:hypothetical protein